MKVFVSTGESYPVHTLSPYGMEMDLPVDAATVERWERVQAEWRSMQAEVGALADAWWKEWRAREEKQAEPSPEHED